MALYAFVQNNEVSLVQEIADDETALEVARNYQNALDVTNFVPKPQVGWKFNGKSLVIPAAINSPEYVQAHILEPAVSFGKSLALRFASENILQGITQAGKTVLVGDALKDIAYYLERGSLYAAEAKMQLLSQNIDPTLSPFVTIERMTLYRNLLRSYLGMPQI